MKTTPSFLLVLLLLVPGPGGSPGLALAQRCPANVTISGPDDVASITTLHVTPTEHLLLLYVHPMQGFKGVSLVAEGPGGELHGAWFPLEDTCFQGDSEWWVLYADASIDNWLHFVVGTAKCTYKCSKSVLFRSVVSLRVVGHGPSAWKLTPPDDRCSTTWIAIAADTTELPSCKASPSPGTLPSRPDNTTSRQPIRPTTSPTSTKPPAFAPPIDSTASKTTSSISSSAKGGVGLVVTGVLLLLLRLGVRICRDSGATEDVTVLTENMEYPQEEHYTANILYGPTGRQDSVNSTHDTFNKQEC